MTDMLRNTNHLVTEGKSINAQKLD